MYSNYEKIKTNLKIHIVIFLNLFNDYSEIFQYMQEVGFKFPKKCILVFLMISFTEQ